MREVLVGPLEPEQPFAGRAFDRPTGTPVSSNADAILTASTAPNVKRPSSSGESRPIDVIHRTRSSGRSLSAATSAVE